MCRHMFWRSSVARSKRAQVLMEPEEYRRLERIASQEGCSVAELIRRAVRERYLTSVDDRRSLVEGLIALNLDVGDWEGLKSELEGRLGAGLP